MHIDLDHVLAIEVAGGVADRFEGYKVPASVTEDKAAERYMHWTDLSITMALLNDPVQLSLRHRSGTPDPGETEVVVKGLLSAWKEAA